MEGEIVNLPKEIYRDYYKEFIYIDKRINKCMYAEDKKYIYETLEAYILL